MVWGRGTASARARAPRREPSTAAPWGAATSGTGRASPVVARAEATVVWGRWTASPLALLRGAGCDRGRAAAPRGSSSAALPWRWWRSPAPPLAAVVARELPPLPAGVGPRGATAAPAWALAAAAWAWPRASGRRASTKPRMRASHAASTSAGGVCSAASKAKRAEMSAGPKRWICRAGQSEGGQSGGDGIRGGVSHTLRRHESPVGPAAQSVQRTTPAGASLCREARVAASSRVAEGERRDLGVTDGEVEEEGGGEFAEGMRDMAFLDEGLGELLMLLPHNAAERLLDHLQGLAGALQRRENRCEVSPPCGLVLSGSAGLSSRKDGLLPQGCRSSWGAKIRSTGARIAWQQRLCDKVREGGHSCVTECGGSHLGRWEGGDVAHGLAHVLKSRVWLPALQVVLGHDIHGPTPQRLPSGIVNITLHVGIHSGKREGHDIKRNAARRLRKVQFRRRTGAVMMSARFRSEIAVDGCFAFKDRSA